jgi:hypothetical protein
VSALVRLVHAIDRLDWAGVRAELADELETDYTSLFGGEPARQTGDELVAQWRGLLPGFTATQHLLGPVLTDGDRVEAHVRAYHRVEDREWLVAGHYVARLAGGRIAALTLQTYYQDGDLDLPAVATERASGGPHR